LQIRAQDGLLQRYLKHTSGKNWAPRQGEMMRYWNFGNSDNFLLLLSNVAEADRCCRIVNDRHATDEDALASAHEFLQESTEFIASFTDDVPDLWQTITAPFQKATQEEIDFVAYGSDEDGDGDDRDNYRALDAQAEMAAFHRSQSADEELAARYKEMAKKDLQERRTGKRDDGSNDDEASRSDDSNEDPDDRSDNLNVNDENDASDSNDSFQQEIQKKRKVSPRKKPAPQRNWARRQTQSTLDGFMGKKRQKVISLEEDSSSEEDERKRPGNSPRKMSTSQKDSEKNHQLLSKQKDVTTVNDSSSSENDAAPILLSGTRRRQKRLILDDDGD
jgi:hypothetical protein